MRARVPALLLVALGLVLAAAFWIHRDALRAPFFADDYLFLDQARGRSLPAALAAPDPLGNYFRPVSRQISFWTVARVSGETPAAFHAVNLALFAAIVALLFFIASAIVGPRGAVVAAAFLALHYAADVPVWWASGSQDLLAVVFALGAIALHRLGRRGWGALALILALFSKETVVLAPIAAVAVDCRSGESWRAALRRAWPLGAALAIWAAAWIATRARRPAFALDVAFDPSGPPAALIHLVQVALGLEWPHDGIGRMLHAPPWIAIVAAVAAVWLAWLGTRAPSPSAAPVTSPPRHGLMVGLVWALAGAVPVSAVIGIWSAYYYLFSLCGVALSIGALAARAPVGVAAAIVALLAWTSSNARQVDEFATGRGAWTAQSHLNRFYLARGMRAADRYLGQLQQVRPTFPANSSLFFAGLPVSVAFQSADGPLLRWAYRDTSLRSYFFTRFTLDKARRGPVFFFQLVDEELEEITGRDSLGIMGYSMILSETPQAARDMLTLAVEHDPADQLSWYTLAWAHVALGEREAATEALARSGCDPRPGPTAQVALAYEAVTRGDTTEAIALANRGVAQHALDRGVHALLADLLLVQGRHINRGGLEAYATRVLAPDYAPSWKRWGLVQMVQGRDEQAVASLERYLELGGEQARNDREAHEYLTSLRRRLPGGELAQAELRRLAPP